MTDRTRAERALAAIIHEIRAEWDERGTLAALRRCSERPLAQVAAAAIHCATYRHDQRTPSVIAMDGEHWSALDRMTGREGTGRAPEIRCDTHREPLPCLTCDRQRRAAEDAPPDRAAEHIAAIRARIRAENTHTEETP